MLVNISYIKLEGKIIDNYLKTKKGWRNKDVEWDNMENVLSNSNVQFSPYCFRNGYKTYRNWSNDKQNMLIFDIDDTMSIQQAQRLFKDYTYMIGTTKSHQKDKKGLVCDRYRLCIPAINIPTNDKVYFRMLSLLMPTNDTQTETRTGAFLGNNDAIIIKNSGKILDCHKATVVAEEQLLAEEIERKPIDEDLRRHSGGSNNLKDLKERLTFEAVVEVLTRVGYEVKGNKFKIREEERTDSATISYRSLIITDYGSGYYNDIFGLLEDEHGMSLVEAIKFVEQSV